MSTWRSKQSLRWFAPSQGHIWCMEGFPDMHQHRFGHSALQHCTPKRFCRAMDSKSFRFVPSLRKQRCETNRERPPAIVSKRPGTPSTCNSRSKPLVQQGRKRINTQTSSRLTMTSTQAGCYVPSQAMSPKTVGEAPLRHLSKGESARRVFFMQTRRPGLVGTGGCRRGKHGPWAVGHGSFGEKPGATSASKFRNISTV